LDGTFSQVDKIIDPAVKEIVTEHLANYGNNPKLAFAEGVKVLHKDGKTPIKRVRLLQSETTLAKLEKTKFGARDKQGKVFKWLAYGNLHHVEIVRNKETGAYSGHFVTMMEAQRRAMTGSKSAAKRGVTRENMIKTDHGAEAQFVMALHRNDLVSVEKDGKRVFYRVQKLEREQGRAILRLHTASTLKNDSESLPDRDSTINALMRADLKKHRINAIGTLSQ
jgi:CRISPR-associated endonuclease Csn1